MEYNINGGDHAPVFRALMLINSKVNQASQVLLATQAAVGRVDSRSFAITETSLPCPFSGSGRTVYLVA